MQKMLETVLPFIAFTIVLSACSGNTTTTIKRAVEARAEDCTISPERTVILGNSFPTTATIEIVYDQHDLKSTQYEFSGEVSVMYREVLSVPAACAERQIAELAKKRGANAVIVGKSTFLGNDSSLNYGFSLTGRLIRYK